MVQTVQVIQIILLKCYLRMRKRISWYIFLKYFSQISTFGFLRNYFQFFLIAPHIAPKYL